MKPPVRLNLFISKYSKHSRREAEELIRKGRVSINHHKIQKMPAYVDAQKDTVRIGKKVIQPFHQSIYIAFNKPAQTLTTSKETSQRPTVYDYFTKIKYRIFTVGRLDWNTQGLLILTNDGDFAQKIIKPKNKIPKTYLAKLDNIPSLSKLEKLKRGVSIPGGHVRAVDVRKKKKSWVQITIEEGKNKQLHYMFNKIGLSIQLLKRIQIGRLKLGSLPSGYFKYLTPQDINKIFQTPNFQKKLLFKKSRRKHSKKITQ